MAGRRRERTATRAGRRSFLVALAAAVLAGGSIAQAADEVLSAREAAPRLAGGGFVLWMRHAQTVPGTGDPANFTLDDCSTQRNLSEAGRAQSRRIGEAFRAAGIRLDAVAHSRWCRCRETAELAFADVTPEPLLDSVFAGRGDGGARARELLAVAARLPATGNAMWVTHQVNISAATGEFTRQGEVVVTRIQNGRFEPVFRIRADG